MAVVAGACYERSCALSLAGRDHMDRDFLINHYVNADSGDFAGCRTEHAFMHAEKPDALAMNRGFCTSPLTPRFSRVELFDELP